MVRHKKATYAMLTPERRFQWQEDIGSRHAARVAAGMSPDSPGPEEIGEVEEVEGDASELMQGVDPVGGDAMEEQKGGDEDDNDDEEGGDEDDEEGVDEDDEDNEEGDDEDDEDDKETAILESIQDEAYVQSNRRFLREEQAKTDVLFDELDAEQEAEADDVDVRMEIVDISDDGE
nr:ribosomal L1 domain-containing protein CG13096-like [Aegilops tauschii subsp. strangulata]